jgi:hypothetical protein
LLDGQAAPSLTYDMKSRESITTAGARIGLAQAIVADEPVKPTKSSSTPQTPLERIRVPLVKTAEGDLDYGVVVKYGGQLARPSCLKRIEVPLSWFKNRKGLIIDRFPLLERQLSSVDGCRKVGNSCI